MRLPAIQGVIDRRILVNYRLDPTVAARALPAPFRPKLMNGYAVAGICLIRLRQVRPAFVPVPVGFRSENAAHRFAVEWDENGETREGVYIPRRDSDSHLNALLGGTVFPGEHHRAAFDVEEGEGRLKVGLRSEDGRVRVRVVGRIGDRLPPGSMFASMKEASEFFERGSLGYSATKAPGRFDGLELQCQAWRVEALDVQEVSSSYFEDEATFPKGSAAFDCALLMRGVRHQWHTRPDLCCTVGV